jgi:hypothetical protein
MTAIAGWENFYVIVGSSAGALIGLQFVVITLIATVPISDGVAEASSAFATPIVIHFCSVLLLAGILTAPWRHISAPAVLWGVLGMCGVVYALLTARRMVTQDAYHPVLEDWLFHACLPLAAYATLVVSAFLAVLHMRGALFPTAAAALLLLFIGIHNAWDAVTYHVFTVKRKHAAQISPRENSENRRAMQANKEPTG